MIGSFNVRDAVLEAKLRETCDAIEVSLDGTGFAFTLFLVELNVPDGKFGFVTTADLGGMVPVLERWCARQKQ